MSYSRHLFPLLRFFRATTGRRGTRNRVLFLQFFLGRGRIVSKIREKKKIVFELWTDVPTFEMIEVFFLSFFLGVKVFSTKTPERIWRVTPSPSQFSPFPDLVINGFRELGSLRSSRNYEETTPSPSRLTCRKRWPCTKLTTYIISERCVAIFALPSPSNSIFPIFTIDSFFDLETTSKKLLFSTR